MKPNVRNKIIKFLKSIHFVELLIGIALLIAIVAILSKQMEPLAPPEGLNEFELVMVDALNEGQGECFTISLTGYRIQFVPKGIESTANIAIDSRNGCAEFQSMAIGEMFGRTEKLALAQQGGFGLLANRLVKEQLDWTEVGSLTNTAGHFELDLLADYVAYLLTDPEYQEVLYGLEMGDYPHGVVWDRKIDCEEISIVHDLSLNNLGPIEPGGIHGIMDYYDCPLL